MLNCVAAGTKTWLKDDETFDILEDRGGIYIFNDVTTHQLMTI